MSGTTEIKVNGDVKEPFLIGVAGGTASGKVFYLVFLSCLDFVLFTQYLMELSEILRRII